MKKNEISINTPVREGVKELSCTIKDLSKKKSIGVVDLKLNAKENSIEALLIKLKKNGVKVKGGNASSTRNYSASLHALT